MTASTTCLSANKGSWISFAPIRRNRHNKSRIVDLLDESSSVLRGRKHLQRTSQAEIYDNSEQTGPPSDDEEDQLDARRPQQMDIERLSAEFGLPHSFEYSSEDAVLQIVDGEGKEESNDDVLKEQEKGQTSPDERNSRIESREDSDEVDSVPLPTGSQMPVACEDDTVSKPPMTSTCSSSSVGIVRRYPTTLDCSTATTSSCLTSFELDQSSRRGFKRVRFSTIEVQEYARCAGDNPSVISGVPLALGWEIVARHYPVTVDDYESHHPRRCSSTESKATVGLPKLQIGASDRFRILMQWGYSRGELKKCIERVDTWRAERKETVEKLKVDDFWDRLLLIRGARKKLSKMFKRRKSKTTECTIILPESFDDDDDDSFRNAVNDFEHV